MVSDDGESFLCTKVEQGAIKKYSCGSLHGKGHFISPKKVVKSREFSPNLSLIRASYNALDFSVGALLPLAKHLQVGVNTLRRLGVGKSKSAWDFPMYNEKRHMIGIKRRNLDGKKWCVRHSRLGIYMPCDYHPGMITIICEGESDTAAMLEQGYNAIGRPSASTGKVIIKGLLSPSGAIIIADTDDSGLGLKEAQDLAGYLNNAVVVETPYKDVREWIESGTFTKTKFNNLISNPGSC